MPVLQRSNRESLVCFSAGPAAAVQLQAAQGCWLGRTQHFTSLQRHPHELRCAARKTSRVLSHETFTCLLTSTDCCPLPSHLAADTSCWNAEPGPRPA